MEGGSEPSAINSNLPAIKAAQEGIGKLDILVCGECHSVFHFVEEFQEHRTKDDACSKVSHFKNNVDNEQKAQVWAFLLWKGSQLLKEEDKDTWKIYQQWCTMDGNIRESWITAGKTIQTFTKVSTAKMTEVKQECSGESSPGKTMMIRKVIRNGQPDDSPEVKKETKMENKVLKDGVGTDPSKREKFKLKPTIKPKGKHEKDLHAESDEEYVVEKVLAKRFNTKKRCSEYLLKWEGYPHESNSWEPAESVSQCRMLLDEFEKNLAKQKEIKAAQQQQNAQKNMSRPVMVQRTIVKAETVKAGPSSAAQAGRPMRSSKTKAMDQVKQWCGSMKDEDSEILGKRRADYSDSDSDIGAAKRNRLDTGSDDDWTAESEEDKLAGRSDVIQRAFSHATMPSNGSNRKIVSSSELMSLGLQSPLGKTGQPVLVADAKGVVKVDPKQMPNLTSGVYVMSRKDGIIKLDSSPGNKIAMKSTPVSSGVLMVQNRADGTNIVRKQIIPASQANSSVTPIKVINKPDGTQVVTPMKVVSKGSPVKVAQTITQKTEPVKIQPKPDPNQQMQQIHVVTTPLNLQPRLTNAGIRPTAAASPRGVDGRPLLPRPTLRGAAPTSVLGIGTSIRSPVRAPAPRQVIPSTQTRVVQRRVSTGPLTSVQVSSGSPVGITQIKKTTVMSSPMQKMVQKTVTTTSPVQMKPGQKTPIGKPQSLISPQQKLLMAKRKAQEQAGIVSKPPIRGLLHGARGTTPARGRGGRIVETVMQGNKPKESKLAEGDGLHMEFHQVGSESSSDDETEIPPAEIDAAAPPAPESPPRPFTLCPLTGRIIGPDGEPMEQSEPETTSAAAVATQVATTTSAVLQTPTTLTVTSDSGSAVTTTELVLPNLEALTESGGIMRVEMSPGGTTGTIVQTSEAEHINLSSVTVSAPDLPCLDDTVTTTSTSSTQSAVLTASGATHSSVSDAAVITTASTTTASSSETTMISSENIKGEVKPGEEKKVEEEASGMVTITGDDGVVYQVTGQAEDGQTLLVTRDGNQQCVYVTTAEQQGDGEGSVLTLDTAVAEAVAQLIPDQVNLGSQFYVKEGEGEQSENQMVMSIMDESSSGVAAGQEDGDQQAQVVAQVVQADEPTPGGTRRVVLLLPDGNFMMTEVDEEQYAALELDK